MMNWNPLNKSDAKVQSIQPAHIATTLMSPKVSVFVAL